MVVPIKISGTITESVRVPVRVKVIHEVKGYTNLSATSKTTTVTRDKIDLKKVTTTKNTQVTNKKQPWAWAISGGVVLIVLVVLLFLYIKKKL
jgi:hypothetical protein